MSDVFWFAPLGEAYLYDDDMSTEFYLDYCSNYGCTLWVMQPRWLDICSLDLVKYDSLEMCDL